MTMGLGQATPSSRAIIRSPRQPPPALARPGVYRHRSATFNLRRPRWNDTSVIHAGAIMVRACNPTGEKVRVIVPVHLYGLCCDMNAIMRIAEEFGCL